MKTVITLVLLSLTFFGGIAQEHARILFHSTVYSISSAQSADIEERYQIRINSEQGKKFAVYQDYSDKFRKIASITVDILDPQGNRIKRLRRGDGVEVGFNPSYEISDAKALIIPVEYQQYPFVVEVTTKVALNGFISLPTWVPRDQFNLAVDESKLEVRRPLSVDIRFKKLNITGSESTEEGVLVDRFEVKNLPGIDKKMRYEDFYNMQPKVMISPARFRLDDAEGSLASWREFGNWFLMLNNDTPALSEKTKAFIDSQKNEPEYIFIQKLYEYMQDRTRYVSIQLGIGGFKSLPTEEVEKFGYGDCKALTTYMKNMLKYAGIKSNYVLTRAGNDVPDVIKEFPNNQFNHVYLGIPSARDTIYLECTSQTSPTNYTGTFTDDRNALWIDAGKSKIIRSRIYDHKQNEKTTRVEIALDKEGNSTIEFNVVNRGVFFDELMIYNAAPADYVSNYNHSKFSYSDFTLKNFSFKQPDKASSMFEAKYSLHVKGLGKSAGSKMIIPNVPTAPLRTYLKEDEMMKFCSIKRGITLVDEVEVKVPADFWIYNIPEKENMKSRFGEYRLSTEFDGEKLKVRREVVLYKGDYTKEEYDEFRKFYDKVEKIENRKLLLNSKT